MSHGARAALDEGLKAGEQGALREALEHFGYATRLAPDSAPAQLALGEAAEVLGEFDEALGAYQAAARRAPSTTTWLRLGELADRMGHVDLAILSLEGAYGPWREHAWRGLKVGATTLAACVPKAWPSISAVWGQRLQRYDEALGAYSRALAMNPADADAHANVGWILLKVGRQAEGLRELQVAVRLDPNIEQAPNYLDAQFGRDARQGPTPFGVR